MTGIVPRPSVVTLTRPVVLLSALLLAALAGGTRSANAQTAAAPVPAPNPSVAGVEVRGRSAVDSTRIVRTFDVPIGSAYDPRAVQAGLKKLWATGLFNDLAVYGRTDEAGVHLRVDVAERPHVATVDYTGLDKQGGFLIGNIDLRGSEYSYGNSAGRSRFGLAKRVRTDHQINLNNFLIIT